MIDCEFYSCRLSEAACIKRQALARQGHKPGRFDAWARESHCADCGQGRDVRKKHGETMKNKSKTKRNPVKTISDQDKPAPNQDKPAIRICTRCGQERDAENDFYQAKSKRNICKPCLRAAQREYDRSYRKKRRQRNGSAPARKEGKMKRTPHITPPAKTSVIVDFEGHPELLTALTEQAAHDLRTVDAQALWTIREALTPKTEK